jgi:MATE family multidrug resistance protein
MAALFMAASGIGFACVPRLFFSLFSASAAVTAVGVPLLYCSAAFQVFDGVQVAYTGALRGFGETQRPMWYNVIGHWLVGLPVGALLCFKAGWGATGLWTGLVAGLVCVAGLLSREWGRREAALLVEPSAL